MSGGPALPSFYWARSATGERRYVLFGDSARSLYPSLDYMEGMRGRAERWLMRLAPHPRRQVHEVTESELTDSLRDAAKAAGGLTRGLLLATGYYKETVAVGPVVNRAGAKVFLKVYKTSAGAERAKVREDRFLDAVREASVATVRGTMLGERTIGYPVIDNRGKASESESLKLALELGKQLVSGRGGMGTEVPLRAREVIAETISKVAAESFMRLVDSCWTGLNGLNHGDVTPWNILRTGAGHHVLIDYERSFVGPAFYDLVYSRLRVRSFTGRRISLKDLAKKVPSTMGERPERIVLRSALCVCLATLKDAIENPANADRLVPALQRQVEETLTVASWA